MTSSDQDHENKTYWLADAMAGNFSTMPNPFAWEESAAFAHVIDGYGVAGGVSECQAITRGIADFKPDSGDRLTWAVHLWVALFGEHRRDRHGGGYPPSGEALLHKNVLCEELREALQALGPDDLDRLRAIMAKHPGMEVERVSKSR